ncbi:MAG TPA: hypothetical protein VF195_12825 [Actinomycetota bacterium]
MRRLGVTIVMLLVACTSEPSPPSPSGSPRETPSGDPVEVTTGPTPAAEAMRRLCVAPDIEVDPVREMPTPPAIAEVADQVESVRGLDFDREVNVEPITEPEMDQRLADYLGTYYPKRFYARRSEAWQTIGALPRDVGYLEAIDAYQQGQVLGFYNSQNEELVYTGDAELNRIEQFVLAHELTHAIDDQHFDLDRLDGLVARCEEERFQAALGIVEGSANHFATQVLIRFPIQEVGPIPGDDPGEVPPFIVEMQAFPYTTGQRFADALSDADGPSAIDGAMERFPTTTEQVMHPTKFPHEAGESVDVADFAPTFGSRWRDLDVMVVGELWLKVLLHLRLDDQVAASAAAGWGGGTYRAWTDGDDVAVIMSTVWDTPKDAQEFSRELDRWVSRGTLPGLVMDANGTTVHAGFASREPLMGAVLSILRSL